MLLGPRRGIAARQEILPPSASHLKVSRSRRTAEVRGRVSYASVSPAADIDQLYQLPLEEFTSARNALAKGAGKNAAAIRGLTKPPVPAWAVNQLYWRNRRTWDALVEAAENLRRANKAVLSGRSGDVRAAGQVHDEAVQDALKATLAILSSGGHPVTDATKQSILTTLRALPGDEAAGRLTRVLQPGGFEMLAGLTIAKATKASKSAKDAKDTREAKDTKERATELTRSKADAKALTQAREAAASADRALKDAEQAARRHEFEIARATRDEERAAKAVEQARAALDHAKAELAGAEREHTDAGERRETAEEAAKKAASAVTAARRHADAAAAALKRL
jgi:hypothetical protein